MLFNLYVVAVGLFVIGALNGSILRGNILCTAMTVTGMLGSVILLIIGFWSGMSWTTWFIQLTGLVAACGVAIGRFVWDHREMKREQQGLPPSAYDPFDILRG